MIDTQTFLNLGRVIVFVLVGGVFATTEIALVSLRDSQVSQSSNEAPGSPPSPRDPNRFLAAVQIGVSVAGCRRTHAHEWNPEDQPASRLLGH